MPELATELKSLVEQQGKAWHDYREENDKRIQEMEEKGGRVTAETDEKIGKVDTELNRLSAEIQDIMKKMNRPGASANDDMTMDQSEHKGALHGYLRKGEESGLHELERKALNMGSDPDGGYLVDVEMDRNIDRIAATVTGFRGLAAVRTIGTRSYKKLVKTRGVSGGWVGEQEDSSEGTGPQFSELEIVAHRMYAEPWITNDMLEDEWYDMEADLTDEAGITFGETEGTAFINGTGVGQPMGFLGAYSIVADASYAWGKLGYIKSGAAGAFASSNPGDKLIDLQHALKQQYRNGAVFLTNDVTLSKIRQIKDGSGNFYLWNPDPAMGFGGMLLGSQVVIDDFMPTLASASDSLAYGNFRRGYTVVDRRGIAVIRDNVTKKGTTKFHFSRRVGGGVTNFEAIKVMRFSA